MKRKLSSFVRAVATALCLPVALVTSGCAPQSRLVQPATIASSPSLDWRAGAAGEVKVTLSRLIVREGPGSWVRDASWDEYVLVLANESREPATVLGIELSSEHLKSLHTTEKDALESASRDNLESLKTAGLVLGVGLAGASTALTVAFLSAGWTVVTPLAPIAILVGGVSAYRSLSRRSEDSAVIEHQLERRGLRLPVTLGPATDLRGSAFFPITPAPTRLQVRYAIRGELRTLDLDLKRLAGLHLAAPP